MDAQRGHIKFLLAYSFTKYGYHFLIRAFSSSFNQLLQILIIWPFVLQGKLAEGPGNPRTRPTLLDGFPKLTRFVCFILFSLHF